MKRKKLIQYILNNSCVFIREGSKHSIFFNPLFKRVSAVPRHTEIDNFLAKKICRDLGIQEVTRNKK